MSRKTDAKIEAEAASPEESEATPEAGDWRAAIDDTRLRGFAERFASPVEAVRSAFELRQKLSTSLTPPGPDARPEQVAEFRRRLGVPDSHAGYDVALPEGLPEPLLPNEAVQANIDAFLQAIHGAGATQEVAATAVDWYYGYLAEGLAQQERQQSEAREAAAAELRREWGGEEAFRRNGELARRAAVALGGGRFGRFLEQTKAGGLALGDHPEFIRAFTAIGQRMAEDSLLLGEGEVSADAETRLAELTRQIHDAAAGGDQARVETLSQERETIAERTYGTNPIVGTGGPGV